jgi:hypothetical protein
MKFAILLVALCSACGDDTVNPIPEAGADATTKDASGEASSADAPHDGPHDAPDDAEVDP